MEKKNEILLYPKKYETMSINAVKRARESIATKQKKEQDEMLDI